MGQAIELAVVARVNSQRRSEQISRFSAGCVGDIRKCKQARELFRDRRYNEVVT